MEEGLEETKSKEQDLVISHPPLPREPYTWLMITDGENGERQTFYSLTEDRYYVRFVPELQNKYVACCYGGWLVLKDNSTDDCSILNILTMEKLQLPPLHIPPNLIYNRPDCVLSSPKIDRSCRIIFFERKLRKFKSCHLGDSEFIEQELTYNEGFIRNLINFKGKLYALTSPDFNLITADFSDPDLHHEQVVSGESITEFIHTTYGMDMYLVESCEDLLLIFMGHYDYEVSDVKILRADFSSREWVKLETLGDRAIFLGPSHTFSSPASAFGLKGNAVYWVSSLFVTGHFYTYDIEDESISISLPCPIVGIYSSLSWVSFPITCNEEKLQHKDKYSLFEASRNETNCHLQRQKATTKSNELQIELRKTQKKEERETIGSTIVGKESLWVDLPNDLLLEIFTRLFAGDRVAFHSVCRSWYSVPPSMTTQQFGLPLKSSDCASPFLMWPVDKTYHPIYGELYNMGFPDIPGAKVRVARDGWLLMDEYSEGLFFYNPFTKAEIILPDCSNARFYYSLYFSAPPTSADCVVVVAVKRWDHSCAICFMKCEDEGWICREISPEKESFYFSSCNAVIYKGLYYFLGSDASLLIFNPKKDEVHVIEAPKSISDLKFECGQQYMLESDGKLIAVFVGTDGSSVYTCEWNVSKSSWEILGSLGNRMLFVSRPLSLCKRATVSGTGNKIYFPRVVGDGNILFYSLATRRYHTFEMGTSYPNFIGSKFYPQYNFWFMP